MSISSKVTTSGLALDEYCAWRMAARDLGAKEREVWYRAGIAREVKEGIVISFCVRVVAVVVFEEWGGKGKER